MSGGRRLARRSELAYARLLSASGYGRPSARPLLGAGSHRPGLLGAAMMVAATSA